jgi:hypothetical protein
MAPQSFAFAYDDKSSTDEVEIGGGTITAGTAVYLLDYIPTLKPFNPTL